MSYSQYQPRRASPGGFALIVALHAAAIGAVMLIKGPDIVRPHYPATEIFNLPEETEPDPVPAEVEPLPPAEQVTYIDPVRPIVPPPPGGEVTAGPPEPLPPFVGTGIDPPFTPPADPPRPQPVRVEAELDGRYADAFRPPYPPSELRAERDGMVRLRVTIGTDGRVRAVERLSATSDAFWAAAERQALSRWHFRPATVDGRAIESRKVLTLHFRIEDA